MNNRTDTRVPAAGEHVRVVRYTAGNVYAGTQADPDFTITGTVVESPRDGHPHLTLEADRLLAVDELTQDDPLIRWKDCRPDGEPQQVIRILVGQFPSWGIMSLTAAHIVIYVDESHALLNNLPVTLLPPVQSHRLTAAIAARSRALDIAPPLDR